METNDRLDDSLDANQTDPVTEVKEIPLFYAGFWMRLWAYLIDFLIIGSLNRIIINPIFRWFEIPLDDGGIFSAYTIVSSILFFGYFIGMTLIFGQTLGKMVLGIKVISIKHEKLDWKTVLFREWIGRYISAFFFLGYIATAFTQRKQGFHDLLADTGVVIENRGFE